MLHRLRPARLLSTLPILALILASGSAALAADNEFARAVAKGPIYAGLAAFLGGLLTALTPCVYPMIAITVSVFGARQTKSRTEAMLLSTVFVLGIAAMFTPLGVGAGLTGSLFGSALSNRWVVLGIAAVFLVLAGSMFGLFEFVLPSGLTNKLARMGGIGYAGAFVLGLVSGVVAAPCTGPVLTGILLWIGKTQSPWLGAAAMAAFSLGLGVPFWIVGTFAVQLPKSGKWMMGVKSFFGIVLVIVALYYVKNAFPQLLRYVPASSFVLYAAVAAAIAGLALGAVHLGFDEGKARAARKIAGIVLAVLGSVVAVTWIEMPKGELPWLAKESDALARAKANDSPMIVDFTADWCSACKRLARDTFTDPAVRTEIDRFVLLRVDATNDDDPAVLEAQKKYKVAGLPTVIILDSNGVERARFTDFVAASQFHEAIRAVR
jgi:thiol:disulfide interchange protein DsbD